MNIVLIILAVVIGLPLVLVGLMFYFSWIYAILEKIDLP